MAPDVRRKLFMVEELQRMDQSGVFDPDARLELLERDVIGAKHAAVVMQLTHLLTARLGDRALVSCRTAYTSTLAVSRSRIERC